MDGGAAVVPDAATIGRTSLGAAGVVAESHAVSQGSAQIASTRALGWNIEALLRAGAIAALNALSIDTARFDQLEREAYPACVAFR